MKSPALVALLVILLIDALISTFGVLWTLRYAQIHGELMPIAGIRALFGPFDKFGIPALIVAGLIFVSISAFKFLSAFWLWNMRLEGAVLQLILLGVSAIFWYGFELPYGPLFGVPQVILIVIVWGTLT